MKDSLVTPCLEPFKIKKLEEEIAFKRKKILEIDEKIYELGKDTITNYRTLELYKRDRFGMVMECKSIETEYKCQRILMFHYSEMKEQKKLIAAQKAYIKELEEIQKEMEELPYNLFSGGAIISTIVSAVTIAAQILGAP